MILIHLQKKSTHIILKVSSFLLVCLVFCASWVGNWGYTFRNEKLSKIKTEQVSQASDNTKEKQDTKAFFTEKHIFFSVAKTIFKLSSVRDFFAFGEGYSFLPSLVGKKILKRVVCIQTFFITAQPHFEIIFHHFVSRNAP